MTKEEIISIMLEINRPNQAVWSIDEEALEQWLPLLQAIAAAEREACATVCDDTDIVHFEHCMVLHDDAAQTLRNAAVAIRARGQE